MTNESWMQPALQTSEAVLLPALETTSPTARRSVTHHFPTQEYPNAFIPLVEAQEQSPSPEPPIHSHGSMAGRSVLRAVGVHTIPVCKSRCKRK